ncbi:hypothetical protein D9758_018193 [Tetrapyrgos nigripes]|uniref:Uncharacterized protein n=1 Tax=Tetrapyrgos nigripes TaxID=182062 RepID=A0A8H5BTF2_9AGAR|nr:hypothetical protein D9758_018193 [Tetrapyrgos nigripes]
MDLSGIYPKGVHFSLVRDWQKWLADNPDAAKLPVSQLDHMKNFQGSPVHHEFVIFTVDIVGPNYQHYDQRIIAERQYLDSPDLVIYGPWDKQDEDRTEKYRFRKADRLGILDFHAPYPTVSEIASIFVKLANERPDYSFNKSNCFWFAGSVWTSLERRAFRKTTTAYFDLRRKFLGMIWGFSYNDVGEQQQIQQETITTPAADYPAEELQQEEERNRVVREAILAPEYPSTELAQEKHLEEIVRKTIPENKFT